MLLFHRRTFDDKAFIVSTHCISTVCVTQDKCADITERVPVLLPSHYPGGGGPVTPSEWAVVRVTEGPNGANSSLLSLCLPAARNTAAEMLNMWMRLYCIWKATCLIHTCHLNCLYGWFLVKIFILQKKKKTQQFKVYFYDTCRLTISPISANSCLFIRHFPLLSSRRTSWDDSGKQM